MKKNKKRSFVLPLTGILLVYLVIYSCGSSNNNTFKVNGKSKIDNRNGVIIVGDSNKVELKVTKIINNLEIKTQNQIINNIHYYQDSINQIAKFKDSILNKIKTLERTYLLTSKRKKKKEVLEQKKKQQKVLNKTTKRERVYKTVKRELEKILKENSEKTKIEKPKKIAYAKTALEFIKAIDSNTKIILTASSYDISQKELAQNHNLYYLPIKDISNLEIVGQNENPVHIFSNNINDPVLDFYNVNNLKLKNLKIGHSGILDKDIIGCGPDGDVLDFSNCNDVLIESSFLYGCGTQGIDYWKGKRLIVKDTEIYDCTNGIFSSYDSSDILFENCTFKDNQVTSRSFFNLGKTKKIKIVNSKIENNTVNNSKEVLFDTDNNPLNKYLFNAKNEVIETYGVVNNNYRVIKSEKVTSKIEIINTSIKGNEIDFLGNNQQNIILNKITYGSPDNKFRKNKLYSSNN